MSFRARLALVAAAAVALAVIVASFVVYFVVRGQLRATVDDSLRTTAAQLAETPVHDFKHFAAPSSELGGAPGYPQIVGLDGRPLLPPGETTALPVSEKVVDVARTGNGTFLWDAHVNGTHVRMVTFPYAPGFAVEIARPLTEVDNSLGRIKNFLILIASDRRLPAGERERLLKDVVEQLGEMTTLIAELIDLARGEQHTAEPEEVRLDLIAADAVERARRNQPAVSFVTQLEESVVHGVPSTIERAVANLLDNAAKWSSPGGEIEVGVQGPQVMVRDHGPGIDEQDLPHVFDRFYRAPSARGMPGSGLGLAIVRQVAEAHGGGVVAERADGGGTRITLRFADGDAPSRGS